MVTLKKKWGLILLGLVFPGLLALAPVEDNPPCDPAQACFDVTLSPLDVVGDFYIDGVLTVAGARTARLVGAPDTPHTIEARNIQEPGVVGLNDLFAHPDQSVIQQTKPGWIWRVSFYSPRTYLKGMLTYSCAPRAFRTLQTPACRPTIDGVSMPDISAGANAVYNLTPGPHALHTDLIGEAAPNWAFTARDDTVTVTAGRTVQFSASFPLKGQLSIKLLPEGVLADIYVNGALVVAQSASVDLFVTPVLVNTIEMRNVVDPAANGNYKYSDVSKTAATFEGGVRVVYLRPTKVWLTGQLRLYCWLANKAATDDARCSVTADGTQLGMVEQGTWATFMLAPGAHAMTVAVSGASAGRWGGPLSFSQKIIAGGVVNYTARLNLIPAAPPPSAPPPSAPPPITGGGGTSGGFELGGQVANFSAPDKMKHAGMIWVKRQVRWHPGDTASTDLIADAHNQGFKILLSVLGEPGSIAGGANYDDYARFVGELARGGADAIEVWNEMNLDREWPMGEIDPAKYTDLLRRAYTKIKANNPNTMVISGAPSPTGAEGAFGPSRVWNDDRYMRGMAAAGAAKYMDCIGVHYNEGIISPTRSSGDPRDPYYTRYYGSMVSVYYNAFGGARKICFTELGYLTGEGYGSLPGAFGWAGNTTVAQQAQWIAEAASLARSGGQVRLLIVFNVDFTVWGDDPQAGFAIIRPGGACPACDSLRNVTGGR